MRFDALHYQPWLDVRQDPAASAFLGDVLRKRVPEQAFSDTAIEALALASGGVLRDLLTLAQSACVEAYLGAAIGSRTPRSPPPSIRSDASTCRGSDRPSWRCSSESGSRAASPRYPRTIWRS